MAAFTWDEAENDWTSYDLFRHGPVTLFYKTAVLDEALAHLENQNYKVARVDCQPQTTEADFYNAVLFALGILKSEYKNIKPIQFWDLVTDITFGDESGIVLVFQHFDAFYARFPECGRHALQVLAGYQYRWLWFGHRYTTFVQIDNPELELDSIRQQEAHWNRKEYLRQSRTVPPPDVSGADIAEPTQEGQGNTVED